VRGEWSGGTFIQEAETADLPAIVRTHQAAFERFFLTQLGPAFLRGYYETVLEYQHGIVLVAVKDESVAGFVAGFIDPPGFYSLLRKKRLRMGLAALPWLIMHPANLVRALWNYRLMLDGLRKTGPNVVQVAELSSIAVRPDGQDVGTGKQLLGAFVDAARGSGAARVTLTTDAAGNDAANQFYGRAGFTLERVVRRPYGRILNEYELELGSAGPEGVTSQYPPERMDSRVEE